MFSNDRSRTSDYCCWEQVCWSDFCHPRADNHPWICGDSWNHHSGAAFDRFSRKGPLVQTEHVHLTLFMVWFWVFPVDYLICSLQALFVEESSICVPPPWELAFSPSPVHSKWAAMPTVPFFFSSVQSSPSLPLSCWSKPVRPLATTASRSSLYPSPLLRLFL